MINREPFYKKMHQTTALIIVSSLLTTLFLGLSGCSMPGDSKRAEPQADIVLSQAQQKSAQELKLDELQQQIRMAQQQKNWKRYVALSEQLWQQADEENQAAIEYMVWHTLSQEFDSPEKIALLEQSQDRALQSWASLLDAQQQPGLYALQALADAATFHSDALYVKHLVPALQMRFKNRQTVRQLAILLPFKGKYQQVSSQIRNGLLKAYMLSNRTIELRFYDSSETDEVAQRYRQAKQDGADLVIGPLTKEAIEALIAENITGFLALNSVDNANIKAFNFRSQSESLQITQQLHRMQYQRIGILSSESSRDTSTAMELRAKWLNTPENQALLHQYPLKNPNLRKALGGLINEEASQARYNNLRWLLRQKLEFFPRTRQDLQAIVLIGNANQVAVFHPQFEFFQLDIPVYATSNLTPSNLQNIERNQDLAKVIFPTMPALFKAHTLKTPLEAFGWDSFLLATQLANLAPNLCLTQGQGGLLYQDESQQIDKKLIWAQYSDNGILMRWVPPAPSPENKDEMQNPLQDKITPTQTPDKKLSAPETNSGEIKLESEPSPRRQPIILQ